VQAGLAGACWLVLMPSAAPSRSALPHFLNKINIWVVWQAFALLEHELDYKYCVLAAEGESVPGWDSAWEKPIRNCSICCIYGDLQGYNINRSLLPISMSTKPLPRELLLIAFIITLHVTLWRSVFMLEMV
jgi:hypothetical protein